MTQKPLHTKKGIPAVLILVSLLMLITLMYVSIHNTHTRGYSVFRRTWGFDNFLYYEPLMQYGILVFCLALIIPYANGLFRWPVIQVTALISRFRKKRVLLFALVSIASILVFYLLKVKYFFLGDFNLRLHQTMKQEWVTTEYATMRLLYLFAKAGEKAGISNEQSFRLYSYLAGGLYVFISLLIADLTGNSVFRKLFIFLAQLATAMMLLFCGYVEIYATPALLLHVYTYCGLSYLKEKQKLVWPALAMLACIASHFLCAAALPSLLILYYFRKTEKFQFIRRKSNFLIGIVIFVGIVLAVFGLIRLGHVFIMPWTHKTYLTFMSKPHLWESFNGQFLASGFFFIFLIVLTLRSISKKIRWSGQEYFLLAITGGLLFLVFVSNLQRGSGDWDIMSFPAVTMNLLVILLIFRVYNKQEPVVFYLATMLTGITALNSFLWIHVNHTDRSIKKIKDMLVTDPGSYYAARISGAVQTALAYKNNKLFRESEEVALETCNNAARNDVRACVMYAVRLKESGRTEECRVFFEDMLKNRTPAVLEAYLFLLKYYQDTKNVPQTIYYLDKLYNTFKADPTPFINNINFKQSSMMAIFEVYYKYEEPKKDQAHLAEIKNMIQAIKEMQMPARK